MDDIKIYEFFLKLNTFLNRQDHLANRMVKEEIEFSRIIEKAKGALSPEVYQSIFVPMLSVIDKRLQIMAEMIEAGEAMQNHIKEFYEAYKGTVQ